MFEGRNIQISEKERKLLDVIYNLGTCSSEKVFEALEEEPEYLVVMRTMHRLVEKGFLQRIIINQKRLYRTSRNYASIKSYLDNTNL